MLYDVNLIQIHKLRKTFLQRTLEIQKKQITDNIKDPFMNGLSLPVFFPRLQKHRSRAHAHDFRACENHLDYGHFEKLRFSTITFFLRLLAK